jgi:hypothetical protein
MKAATLTSCRFDKLSMTGFMAGETTLRPIAMEAGARICIEANLISINSRHPCRKAGE